MPLRLPLFPLGMVLFPGLALPLHVFEPRYRLLVQELLALPDGVPRRFGVVAIRSGREVGADGLTALYDVGCTAELRRVEAYDDGRYDIVTVGMNRFRLAATDDSTPYLTGDVELLNDAETSDAQGELLRTSVATAFSSYVQTLASVRSGGSGDPEALPELPADPLSLSYLVGASLLVDLPERQALLAQPDAAARLRAELRLIKREVSILRSLPAAPAPELTRMPFNPN